MSASSIRCKISVSNWNAAFPIGTEVIFEGQAYRTWSHAGRGSRNVAVVFLDGIEEPVPLDRLTIPGWERVVVRGAKKHA